MNAEEDESEPKADLVLSEDAATTLNDANQHLHCRTEEIRRLVDSLITIGFTVNEDEKEKEKIRYVLPQQEHVREWFEGSMVQLFMALVIFVNFLSATIEAQLKPAEGTPEHSAFLVIE